MKVRLLAFATARDALGSAEVDLELDDTSKVADLVQLLEKRHPDLAALWPRLAIAVDGELADSETPLAQGSEIALLPPVSGGALRARALLTEATIDPTKLIDDIRQESCGAVILFTGDVRRHNRGRAVDRITYDAYRPMALQALERIAGDLETAHRDLEVLIVHRLGTIPVGETSVAIAVAAPHRESAYAASREALERLKREVPIWKLEHYSDGEARWREEEPLVPDLVHGR